MTPASGPIPAMMDGHGRIEDRRTSQLGPAWLINQQAGVPPAAEPIVRDAHSAVPVSGDGPTLVILSDATPAAVESTQAALAVGARVYVLAPSGWASGAAPGWLREAPLTTVLVRRVLGAPAALVLSGGRGWVWVGPNGPGEWRVALDAGQVGAARLAFLQLYWNRSDDELWRSADAFQWRARAEAPFDVPIARPDATVRLESADVRLPSPREPGGSIYAPDGQFLDECAERVWAPPSGDGQTLLAELVGRGVEVVWSDLGLPTCRTGSAPTVLAASERWALRLALNAAQAAGLARALGHEPEARFETAIQLGAAEARLAPGGRVWRAGERQAEALVAQQDLDAGVVDAASLRGMPEAIPSMWPEPPPVALSARWTWRVRAPRAPNGAVEDPLVRSWRTLDEAYIARIAAALAGLTALEEKEGALGRAFATLGGALIGFGRAGARLHGSLQECRDVLPSALGPERARESVERLGELEAEVEGLVQEVAETERKAREEAERKRQQEEHGAAQEKARRDLAARSRERDEKQRQLEAVDVQINELKAKTEMSNKARKIQDRKLRRDQSRISAEIQRLDHLVDRARADIERQFEYRPSSPLPPGRGRVSSFVPPATQGDETRVPDEALPEVGRLLRAGTSRYLAIDRWEELDRGEAEAERLGARLVAIAEGA